MILENSLMNSLRTRSSRLNDALQPERALVQAMIDARKRTGMTQQQLAEKTGISQSDISKFETGGGNPSIKTLQRLAAGMGMILQVEFKPVTSAH